MKINFKDTYLEIKIPNQPKLMMQKDFIFVSIELTQQIRSIPSFKLALSITDPKIFIGVAELVLEYERVFIDEKGEKNIVEKYEKVLGITEKYLESNVITFFGYTLPINSLRIKKTRYLANNINSAIKTLAPGMKNYLLTNNIATNIFQVSCTDAEKLISLCMKNSSTPWWYISMNTINTRNDENIIDNVNNMILGNNYTFREITKDMFNEGDKLNKMRTKTFRDQKDFNIISDNYKDVFVTKYSSDHRYYLSNLENINYSIKYTIETDFDSEYIFDLGTKIKNELTNVLDSKYLMISKIINKYSYKDLSVTSNVTLLGLNN